MMDEAPKTSEDLVDIAAQLMVALHKQELSSAETYMVIALMHDCYNYEETQKAIEEKPNDSD